MRARKATSRPYTVEEAGGAWLGALGAAAVAASLTFLAASPARGAVSMSDEGERCSFAQNRAEEKLTTEFTEKKKK